MKYEYKAVLMSNTGRLVKGKDPGLLDIEAEFNLLGAGGWRMCWAAPTLQSHSAVWFMREVT